MDSSAINKKLKYIVILLLFVFMILFLSSLILMIISAFGGLKGACWLRYTSSDSGALVSNVLTTTKTISLSASGNYNTITTTGTTTTIAPDPSSFGKWLNAGAISVDGATINITGDVSLCKSYLPNYDIQSGAYGTDALKIEVPRIDDGKFLSLRFPANSSNWRNVVEIFGGDNLQILISPPVTTNNNTNPTSVMMIDPFTGSNTVPVNCSTTVNSGLSAMCGRFSPYLNAQYTSSCEAYTEYTCPSSVGSYCYGSGWNCGPGCDVTKESNGDGTYYCATHRRSGGGGFGCNSAHASTSTAYRPLYGTLPFNYVASTPTGTIGARTFPYSGLSTYIPSYTTTDCTVASQRSALTAAITGYKNWLEEGNGLVYKKINTTTQAPALISSNLTSGTAVRTGSALFPLDTQSSGIVAPGKILYSEIVPSADDPKLLQMAYINFNGSPAGNTGGYVMHLSHTKCIRNNGGYSSDTFTDRGKILYYLLPVSYDINNMDLSSIGSDLPRGYLNFGQGNMASVTVPDSTLLKYGSLNMWLKMNNDPADYKDSKGAYILKFQSSETVGEFTGKVLLPVFAKVEDIIDSTGPMIFKNLTCYNKDQTSCISFFLYIKSMLTLYVIFFGFMFLMGKTQLNQQEFITHALKILIVGGLMNGSTFDFCNTYIFPMMMKFTDQIMANFGGYSNTNPFTFLDEVMSKILFNKLTLFQILSLISFGLVGIVMFLLVVFALFIFVIGVFQGIATYILAKILVSFLIGTAPLFLTFMLFSSTNSFFQKWINNLFRYTLEPVVVILGLAVFTKLFATYLDNVLNFSVCFKCAIPFMVPDILSAILPGFPAVFSDIYLFCLFWFGPWGMDSRMGVMGLSIPDIVGMTIMAFINFTYASFASDIVDALTNMQSVFKAGSTGSAAGMQMAQVVGKAIKLAPAAIARGSVQRQQKRKGANITAATSNASKSSTHSTATPSKNPALQPQATTPGKSDPGAMTPSKSPTPALQATTPGKSPGAMTDSVMHRSEPIAPQNQGAVSKRGVDPGTGDAE